MPILVRLGCGGFKPTELVNSADLGFCIKPVPVLTYIKNPPGSLLCLVPPSSLPSAKVFVTPTSLDLIIVFLVSCLRGPLRPTTRGLASARSWRVCPLHLGSLEAADAVWKSQTSTPRKRNETSHLTLLPESVSPSLPFPFTYLSVFPYFQLSLPPYLLVFWRCTIRT